jgi:hypothetical protein
MILALLLTFRQSLVMILLLITFLPRVVHSGAESSGIVSPLISSCHLRKSINDAHEPPVSTGETNDVDAIDFEAALRAARASRKAGETMELAMTNAELVIKGEVEFTKVMNSGRFAGTLAERWLKEADAKLCLHEAVTMKGWNMTNDGRSLVVGEPLPLWIAEIASRLATHFGGLPPDLCELHAFENGKLAEKSILLEEQEDLVVACISLVGRAHLKCSNGHDETEEVFLDPGCCLLFSSRQNSALGISVGVTTSERNLMLVLRRAPQNKFNMGSDAACLDNIT